MSRFDWLSELLALLQDEHILVQSGNALKLAPAHLLEIDMEDWGRAGEAAANYGCRWAGVWADPRDDEIEVNACLEFQGDYLVLRTAVDIATPLLPSHTPYYMGADRLERHVQDMAGLAFGDHPDARRWTRHQAWSEERFPLRNDFSVAEKPEETTPADTEYPFAKVQGAGVNEIPVGPVHAGTIEPGHFRFQAVGEDILQLEERLGYAHKGIEKIAVGRDPAELARLAGRVSGDSTVAHTWAACQAMERSVRLNVPARALMLRAIMIERERVANHIGDVGAICNDVGFAFMMAQCGRLREDWQRRSQNVFGHRLMMDFVVPGGVSIDIDNIQIAKLKANHAEFRKELNELYDIIDDNPSLEDRLLTTGRLTQETARKFGVLGYVGKASGLDFDVRHSNPYPPYNKVEVKVPVYEDGDVAARIRVRVDEIYNALDLMDQWLSSIPEGPLCADWPTSVNGNEGIGFIEGWRGEIITYVRFDNNGRIARFFPRDPSWFNWPALEKILLGNIVPDFPVCNKSVNGSYSGQDL